MSSRKEMFAALRASGLGQAEARDKIKAEARKAYEAKHTRSIKPWWEYFTEAEAFAIRKYLMEELKGVMHYSNIRVARFDSPSQTRRYKRTKRMGCCGFVDRIVMLDGVKYRIGWNYGH